MSNVRKVTHPPRLDGSRKVSWRATKKGADGARQSKSFQKKGDADAWLRETAGQGGSTTMSVADLAMAHGRYFDGLVKAGTREPGTLDGYTTVLSLHVNADQPFARTKLCDLTGPKCQTFLDDLFARTGSENVCRKARRALVTWCRFGQRRGWLVANPAQPCVVETTDRPDRDEERCEIPPKDQLAAVLQAAGEGPAPARDTALVRLLMFGGFRISELLGAADTAVTTGARSGTVRVRERLERRYVVLGSVKSKKARRDVPIGDATVRAVKTWRLARGPARAFDHADLARVKVRAAGRLFPAPDGAPLWRYDAFRNECWIPLMRRAGLLEMLPDSDGKNRPAPAFGPHTLRHVAASLWIEQGLPPKKVQELLGHSTLQLTMDLYGHLWRDDDADDALAQASERLILKPTTRRA